MDEKSKPLLIYDGDCDFCQYSVDYWQQLTGNAVDYQPYQRVGADYPAISVDDFKQSIKYISPDGSVASAAEASFLTLSHSSTSRAWLWLYRHVPGFAWVSEKAYRFVANHRSFAYTVSRFFWGRRPKPPTYDLFTWIFLRFFGLIFLAAFYSFATQASGLIGSRGIVPIAALMPVVESKLGPTGFLSFPTLFWLSTTDWMIQLISWSGVVVSCLLILNVLPRLCLFTLYILYLSLLYGGQVFMTFQWDMLLLEISLLAIVLVRYRVTGVWLLRWLTFRYILASGLVKILSGDTSWWDYTALDYHFLTQPLPTPLAWYAYFLPPIILKALTFVSLFVELVMPFFIFFPRRLRFWAGYSILAMQAGIMLTGNYNFFNLTSIAITLSLFDDAAFSAWLPFGIKKWMTQRALSRPALTTTPYLTVAFITVTVLASIGQFNQRFTGIQSLTLPALTQRVAPFAAVNTYGPFAVMTRKRYEIVIEGSNDGVNWQPYQFKYKPGLLNKKPRWNIPFQPRLDWQMWFAALGPPQASPWFANFLQRLLENSPEVTALLETNPFPEWPPVFVRALFYDYTYTTEAEYKKTGNWWNRELKGLYFPVASLKTS